MRCLLTIVLLVAACFATQEAAAAPPAAAPTAEQLYEQGLRQMRRGYYTKALESLNRVRNYHRDDPVSVKAQLAIADLNFKKGDFAQARVAYEEFASLHPRHENLDYVTYRIGLSVYRRAAKFAGRDQTDTRSASNVWTGFDSRFPDSDYVEDVDRLQVKARERLANKELFVAKFYARRDAWGAVQGRTEVLLRKYPDTPQTEEALQYLGTALQRWGSPEDATAIRERLASEHPESTALRKLDRELAKPPGVRPDEKVFVRPYRIRSAGPVPPPQQTQP
jgi:outer membrane protein assembly factor BamD